MTIEITRDFEIELQDVEKQRQERLISRAIKTSVITADAGAVLLTEIWGIK